MFDRPLKILFVSSEVVPFAKTGGLADVAGSLPKALATVVDHGLPHHDVRVAMPRYKMIEDARYVTDFPVWFADKNHEAIIRRREIEAQFQGAHDTVLVYMIDNYQYYYRDGIYAFDDEAERFGFFCKAVLEMLPRLGWQPDVIHCNDWQCGPIPLFLKTHYRGDPFFSRIATVFTIHNLQYQGNYPKGVLPMLGLGKEHFRPEELEFYGSVSFMKAGIKYADVLSTVSRTYAREIQTPEYGQRMEGVLRQRAHELYGIVNGINYHEFNPKTDPRLHRNYDADHWEHKKENKYTLQREVNLPVRDVPVIGLITRLVDQKGLDLIAEISEELMRLDIQLVVLGKGDKYYEDMFREMKVRHPGKIAAHIGFNVVLAQRIYAGSDMFLMPSRFEPCGLGQLISLRYGTIPIVRETGGLADTVSEYDPATGGGNGFVFKEYDARALYSAIARALKLCREDHQAWGRLVRNAMEMDFSWARSAVEYLQLYRDAMEKAGEERGIRIA